MVFLSTPSARRATQYWVSEQYTNQFLSTPSARRATEELIYKRLSEAISIHALREEGDLQRTSIVMMRSHFYPRPPRGGRLPRPA